LEAHAPEIIQGLAEHREPIIITQDGRATAVLQDIDSYEEIQETLALLKILALGEQELKVGQMQPVDEAFAEIRAKLQG
jgi:PHD/YefM family antitoxin component YafN of YafNO toxin-antitoxin module